MKLLKKAESWADFDRNRDIFVAADRILYRDEVNRIYIDDMEDVKHAVQYEFDQHGADLFVFNSVSYPELIKQIKNNNVSIEHVKRELGAVYDPWRTPKKGYKANIKAGKKITRTTLKSLFYNRKIQSVITGSYYTDDYAYDNAMNFQKGVNNDVEEFYRNNILKNYFFKSVQLEEEESTEELYCISVWNSWSRYYIYVKKD